MLSDSITSEERERPAASSPFKRAVDQYVQSRKSQSSTPQFVKSLQNIDSPTTKEDVQRAIVELERSSTGKASTRRIRNVLSPVIRVLSDYAGIVNTLGKSFFKIKYIRVLLRPLCYSTS